MRLLRFEVFTAATMKNAVFWDVPDITLMMEAIWSSETSVLTRATRRTNPSRRHSSTKEVSLYYDIIKAGLL
jgi:hypothetical protein